MTTCIFLILEAAILYYVAREYYESKETNEALTKLLNKQRNQKKRISADKIIKDVLSQESR